MSQEQPGTSFAAPCEFATGKTLGRGTYAIVKEATHIKTGKKYACKVINKSSMVHRTEQQVLNEIHVLRTISQGHPNVLTLVDCFASQNNIYIVTDLCSGGELFDRICQKQFYYERDACHLVRIVASTVKYLHDRGIVHRDLKPENLLFKSPADDSELLIADFGLSRVIDDRKLGFLTTTCGTPAYMAPEIFTRAGHGKPVDIWAMGVISYFLLCGYTPFDRDTSAEEMQAIVLCEYSFEPVEYWTHVSEIARDFIRKCLVADPRMRLTAEQALAHPWLSGSNQQAGIPDPASTDVEMRDLLPAVKRNSTNKRRRSLRSTVLAVTFANRALHASDIEKHRDASHLNPEEKNTLVDIQMGKRRAEEEDINPFLP